MKKILIIISLFFLLPIITSATVDVSIPDLGSEYGLTYNTDMSSIPAYITRLYQFGIGISGILAVGMIVFGAILYSTSAGQGDRQREGKDMITSALWGILLLFGAYLILKTINPDLVLLREPNAPVFIPHELQPISTYRLAEAQKIRDKFTAAGVGINKPECSNAADTDCTSVYGLPGKTIQDIIAIKNGCNCDVVITGGTEAGHQSHGVGNPMIDLRYNKTVADWIKANFLGNITAICTTDALQQYRHNCNFKETQTHLHIQFKL